MPLRLSAAGAASRERLRGAVIRGFSLLGVFVLAKAIVLWGRELPLSPWTPAAYLWQDIAVAAACFGLDLGLQIASRSPGPGWALYAGNVLYAAANVPIARLLATPLTPPMLRAARGTLADSIAHHLTAANALLALAVLAAAAGLPLLLRRARGKGAGLAAWGGAAAAALAVAAGPSAVGRVETLGLHRNPLAALAAGALRGRIPLLPSLLPPSLPPPAGTTGGLEPGSGCGWRDSPFPSAPPADLSRWRGRAGGRDVILMMLESTGAQYLGIQGAAADPMPRLTELAREAILFENAYCVYPESIKGLFSVLASMDPALDTRPEAYSRCRESSIAAALEAAGYRSGLFHSGRFLYLGMESIVRGRGFRTLADAGDIGGVRESSFGVDEASTVRRILSWIDALEPGERYFVAYLPVAGHHPYETPEPGPFPDRDERGRYLNALRYADTALGSLLDGLRSRGRLEQTIIILAGDHGEAFGQHPGNFGHTFFLFEENVRVPLVIAAPGLIRESLRVAGAASLIDIAPTILDLLGLQAPAAWQGQSLLDRQPSMALFLTDYSLSLLGLRDGRWKFIHQLDSGRSMLFDLETDPEEFRDLSAAFPERAGAYHRRLLDWAAARNALIARWN